MATTRSNRIVSRNVVIRTMTSLFGAVRQRRKKVVQSAMFAATTRRTAASVVIGIRAARGIRASRMTVSVTQCTIPAIGVRPPLRTLAAVRAMAPVAGIPPKRPEKILPSPCPISSALDLWVSPIIPSETTAESSDSIPARMAMVKAGESICEISDMFTDGSAGAGKEEESVPYTLPMVLTGSCAKYVIAVVMTMATREPGILSVTFGQTSMMTTAAAPMSAAVGFSVPI